MRGCGVSWWLLGVVCDSQSNCTMASHQLPLWGSPQRCCLDASRCLDASCLRQCCMASWTRGLLMVISSWRLGGLSWSHSPHRPAESSPASPLTGGLEGPEKPAHDPLPLLKYDGGQHEKDAESSWSVTILQKAMYWVKHNNAIMYWKCISCR